MAVHPKLNPPLPHDELHRSDRTAWLRASVLGANDGIVSTASLLIGVSASSAARSTVLITGVAAVTAGALAMAAGEYVSVSSQADLEKADIAKETKELLDNPAHEEAELAAIYRARGLSKDLAKAVAHEMHARNPLEAHIRDELGFSKTSHAQPVQAALVSAIGFTAGGIVPLAVAASTSSSTRILFVAFSALALLATSGALAGRAGGASPQKAALRVLVGGGLAMAVTAVIGRFFGVIA